jgi:[lysine-biosynthesis-protein LysW]--L-2-aminoadipate ligase
MIAYTPQSALEAIERLGYPVVLKPPVGSWGRLLAKINDREAAEAVLEHKEILGSYHHSIFYIQEYVPKRGGDIRAFVVGDRVIGASYRSSQHWITNVARGASTAPCPVTPEMEEIALRSAQAVGGEILGVDLVETDEGLKVIEINTGAEFKGLLEATGVDVPTTIVDYMRSKAR